MAKDDKTFENLPNSAVKYINLVIKNMRYRKKARDEVREELIDHFELYLKDCATNEEKEQKAQQLISEFGDAKLLAILMRRAKKRCRPQWQKILVKSFAAALVIFAYLLICASWLRIGTPTIRINYAQWLTDRQKQGRDESLNAMPEINKAAELTEKTDGWPTVSDILRQWPGDMNDDQKAAIKNFLAAGNETIDSLNTALQKPYCWTDYNAIGPLVTEVNSMLIANPQFMESRMQLLAQYRQITHTFVARINWRTYSGNIDGAISDTISLFNLAYHFEGHGLLVEQLVAVAIEGLAHREIAIVLAHTDIPAAQLKRLQDELTATFAKHEQLIDITVEKATWYAVIQQGFTDDGKGNGKMLKAGVPYFVRDWKDAVWSFLTFSYPDRQQALAQVEKMFAEEQQKFQTTPWQMKNKISAKQPIAANSFLWTQIITPAYDRISFQAWRTKTQREATLTILAALRFQKEKGKYPDNLDELVQAGYLTKLPVDPFSDKPIAYRKTDNSFLLYSWGENLKDDDGQIARDEKGKPKKFADTGDWIFSVRSP